MGQKVPEVRVGYEITSKAVVFATEFVSNNCSIGVVQHFSDAVIDDFFSRLVDTIRDDKK